MDEYIAEKRNWFFFLLRHGSHIGVRNNNKIVNGLNPGVIIIIMSLTTNNSYQVNSNQLKSKIVF